jgi:hypothetical protein
MKTSEFKPFQRVIYIPNHAHGDKNHKDVERGIISALKPLYDGVFVRFDADLRRAPWNDVTGKSCKPEQLEPDTSPLVNHRGETVIVLADGTVDHNKLL